MRYYPKVQGERIYLSPIHGGDLELYTKWMNDPDICGGIATATKIINREVEQDMLNELMRNNSNFAVIKREGDELIGNVGFSHINHIMGSAECGILIGEKENRHKGYGSEALILLLGYGFNILNFNNIMLKVFSFNESAVACYKKVGFKEIGQRRNSYFYNGQYHNDIYMDMLAEEYRALYNS